MLGLSERTLRRHLVEDSHPWSETVKHLLDKRNNYGEMLAGKDEEGRDKLRPCITSMVLRFFPRGRRSNAARVKRWGRRDLLHESDEGRTRPTRRCEEKLRYRRQPPRMSGYRAVEEQIRENSWLMVKLGQMVSESSEKPYKDYGSLYADIPKNHVLDALRSDLKLALEGARERGASVSRARARWVDMAAKVLAARHQDDKPLPYHQCDKHVTHFDGFTDQWRLLLWTAVKTEMYGGTARGWWLLRRMVNLAQDGLELGAKKPSA